jgi:hypothetical protein
LQLSLVVRHWLQTKGSQPMAEVTCGSQENATAAPVRLNASRSAEYFANEFRLTSPQLYMQARIRGSVEWNNMRLLWRRRQLHAAAAHLSTLMKSTPNSRASDLASCDS